ncbi:MAG TPA: LLM class flavin-dependent oxidoreductase, partial [Kofleriaceae bacterium]|nr:LLM class flavin-dependent oxidoreductase [Kofleriaceae bacterium]
MTNTGRPVELSVIFFSDSGPERHDGYQLVFDLAEFADRNGFTAVWVPERHLHPFGGSYPNPAVLAAALAQRTRNVRIRAGSVVLPLHHPIEVVESWGMVDQLSSGRVDVAFASGWNPNDFIVSPGTYESLRDVWLERIPIVQALWRGEPTSFTNPRG